MTKQPDGTVTPVSDLEPVADGLTIDFSSCDVPSSELDALAEALVLQGVPFRFEGPDTTFGWHISYRSARGWQVSVIYSPISYGHKFGLLEAASLPVRDVQGWLTAADVLREFPPMVTL